MRCLLSPTLRSFQGTRANVRKVFLSKWEIRTASGLTDLRSEVIRDPLASASRNSILVLDGGLATHMESLGEDINHELWSAKCLISKPSVIRQAHRDFYQAGADVAITASYQAHLQGFKNIGVNETEATAAVVKSVELAREAASGASKSTGLVAGSVGSYGASLHNGAEYTGDFPGMNVEKLVHWHRPRMQSLVDAKCDILACETVPCLMEANAFVQLVTELQWPAWVTFSCKSGTEVCSGELFKDCIATLADCPHIVGAGVNCTAPEHVASLVEIARATLPSNKHVIVYPNSGETYDGDAHEWKSGNATSDEQFVEYAKLWAEKGADCIGGCCQTTTKTIALLKKAF